MTCSHIMLDLETLSLRKDAAIIQIAAVAFDPETGELGASFNAYIRDPSGHVDVQTVAWWMQQAHAAKIGAALCAEDAMSEDSALGAFNSWLQYVSETACIETGIVALWSHGATADIVWLENAYSRQAPGGGKPWSYKIERDTRTLYALAPGGMPAVAGGVDEHRQHDAAYDCEVQVRQVVGALRALRNVAVEARLDECKRVHEALRADLGAAPTQRTGFGPGADLDEDGADCRNYAERPLGLDERDALAMHLAGKPDVQTDERDAAPDSFGHTAANEPGFKPGSQF